MMGTQRRDFESVAEHLLLCKCPRFSYPASPVKYIKQWTMRKTLPKTLESWCESQKTIPSLTDKWVESSQLFSFSFASLPLALIHAGPLVLSIAFLRVKGVLFLNCLPSKKLLGYIPTGKVTHLHVCSCVIF